MDEYHMKLKCQPEDFRVEELTTVQPLDQGPYAFYRLTKRGLGTPEALEAIRRRWNLPAAAIQHGGLKDRHAVTIQYLTIRGGPMRWMTQSNLQLEPLGRLDRGYGPNCFKGNRFAIILRDLDSTALDRARAALASLPADHLPNYFDDQRFGSVTSDGRFIAEAWLRGEHETALWLAIAAHNPLDRPDTRNAKQILRALWNNWTEAKNQLERSHTRSIITYLCDHPADFKGAFARLRKDLRTLYFSAFQSHLWNLFLDGWIRRNTRPDQRVELAFKTASLVIQRNLDPEQSALFASTSIPLPTTRTPKPEGPMGEVVDSVLSPRSIAWSDLRVRHLKDVFLSKGNRPATFGVANLQGDSAPDDLYPGRSRLDLRFELPRGSYATLLVKRLTEAA
jgi:tRNA pseudouridine13 synthase